MSILNTPSKHPLHKLLRELKWGRPAADQRFLLCLADKVEAGGIGNTSLEQTADELEDPANWWKKEDPSD